MEYGYGRLESIIPPITAPAWIWLPASTRGPCVYGFRNRADSHGDLTTTTSRSIREFAWGPGAKEVANVTCPAWLSVCAGLAFCRLFHSDASQALHPPGHGG